MVVAGKSFSTSGRCVPAVQDRRDKESCFTDLSIELVVGVRTLSSIMIVDPRIWPMGAARLQYGALKIIQCRLAMSKVGVYV